jgi:hypothetical protein
VTHGPHQVVTFKCCWAAMLRKSFYQIGRHWPEFLGDVESDINKPLVTMSHPW